MILTKISQSLALSPMQSRAHHVSSCCTFCVFRTVLSICLPVQAVHSPMGAEVYWGTWCSRPCRLCLPVWVVDFSLVWKEGRCGRF